MRALSLLVEFFGVFDSLRPQLAAGRQQLAVAEDGGKGIIQFVGHARNKLANRGKSFAVQQLLLGLPEVFISLARLLVKNRTLDSTGNLAANGNEQVYVRGRKLARRTAAHHKTADHPVLRPKDDDVRASDSFFGLCVAENRR